MKFPKDLNNKKMNNLNFHHIGIACKDITETAKKYQEIGYEKGNIIFDPLQNINICFLNHSDMPAIELLSPVDEKSPIVTILNKNGVIPYHICYSTDDIHNTIRQFRNNKYVIVSPPKKACAIGGKNVAFMFHKDMGLIEIVEN